MYLNRLSQLFPFLEQLGNSSPIPKTLQELKIVEYDTSRYPFRKAVADILDLREDELVSLHQTERGAQAFRQGGFSPA